jgi:glycosyltransferase involved in cell wall biosynthesis
LVRIGVNALLLSKRADYRRTGVSRYVERLMTALPGAMLDAELVAYAGPGVTLGPGVTVRPAPAGMERPQLRIPYERVVLPILARRDRLGLFHGPVNALPRGLPCRSVVTIHDLALLRWPDQVTGKRYHYLTRAIRDAARLADRVIAVSEATKLDIVELLDVPADRISVTPLGVDARFRRPTFDALAAFRKRAGIAGPYVLAVGTLEPRKNLIRLLRAFATLAGELPHQLVVVGPQGWRHAELREVVGMLDLGDRLRLTGFVPDDDLPFWYAAADLFVLASLYEGFGLPLLEAMACATPVVTANVSSMPEVAGEAAVYIDPLSVDSIAEGIRRALTSRDVQRRLAQAGVARARDFTWTRTAELTAAVYREALR